MNKLKLPVIDGIDNHMCAKYARLASKELSGAEYVPADAWDLGRKNQVVAKLEGDLENFTEIMTPGESIVIFHYKESDFNLDGRIGTHAGVYLGCTDNDIVIAEQFHIKQRKSVYTDMRKNGLSARQILAPRD